MTITPYDRSILIGNPEQINRQLMKDKQSMKDLDSKIKKNKNIGDTIKSLIGVGVAALFITSVALAIIFMVSKNQAIITNLKIACLTTASVAFCSALLFPIVSRIFEDLNRPLEFELGMLRIETGYIDYE